MAKYIVCETCGNVVEYKPEHREEGGIQYTVFKCPACNTVKNSNRSYIHYGNDGKK